MEQHRRLAVLCSHLRPTNLHRSNSHERSGVNDFSRFSRSNCDVGVVDHQRNESEKLNEEDDCVFCMIIRGESPAFKLYEDATCLCILDSNPLIHGHSLIIPKSHFPSLEVTPPSVVAAMCSTVPFLSRAIMKATHSDSFNLLGNTGAAAGQVVFHTHLHIIPRKAHDRLWTSKGFGRLPLKHNQETTSLADCIREQLSSPINNFDSCKGQRAKIAENS